VADRQSAVLARAEHPETAVRREHLEVVGELKNLAEYAEPAASNLVTICAAWWTDVDHSCGIELSVTDLSHEIMAFDLPKRFSEISPTTSSFQTETAALTRQKGPTFLRESAVLKSDH
jgi:hypothetical protein